MQFQTKDGSTCSGLDSNGTFTYLEEKSEEASWESGRFALYRNRGHMRLKSVLWADDTLCQEIHGDNAVKTASSSEDFQDFCIITGPSVSNCN